MEYTNLYCKPVCQKLFLGYTQISATHCILDICIKDKASRV